MRKHPKLEEVIIYKDRIHDFIESKYAEIAYLHASKNKQAASKIADFQTAITTALKHLDELKIAMDNANNLTWLDRLRGIESQRSRIYQLGNYKQELAHTKRLRSGGLINDSVIANRVSELSDIIDSITARMNAYNRKKTVKLTFDLYQYLNKTPKHNRK